MPIDKLESLDLEQHPIFKSFLLLRFVVLIFIFDTTPLTVEMKDKITTKISKESFFFSPCDNLKSILLK